MLALMFAHVRPLTRPSLTRVIKIWEMEADSHFPYWKSLRFTSLLTAKEIEDPVRTRRHISRLVISDTELRNWDDGCESLSRMSDLHIGIGTDEVLNIAATLTKLVSFTFTLHFDLRTPKSFEMTAFPHLEFLQLESCQSYREPVPAISLSLPKLKHLELLDLGSVDTYEIDRPVIESLTVADMHPFEVFPTG